MTRVSLLSLVLLFTTIPLFAQPRHLFLDPEFVRDPHNVALRVNPPQQREVVIRPDQPWEKLMISLFLTVRDEDGKLRMWYICRDADNVPNVAYAESKDGIHWTKPNLGIVDYHGSKENNLVGLPSLEGTPYRDPKAKSPDEQYIYVTHLYGTGILRYTSPDGLRWKQDAKPILPFSADTQNVTFWDEREGKYVVYLRGWDIDKDWTKRLRKVVRLSTDSLSSPLAITPSGADFNPARPKAKPHFVNEVPTVLAVDDRDPPNSDIYNISAMPYPPDPRWYVGFPSFFQRENTISDGRLEAHFVGSTDGVKWHRYDRAPYAKPGLAGSDTANMVFLATGMAIRGDEIWQYAAGFRTRHGDVASRKKQTDGVIHRYVQRLDGFVSLDFGDEPGRCSTGVVKVDGDRLLLNVDTGALGSLHVGLLDANGKPIAGFEAENSRALRVNSTGAAVTWDGKELSALKGKDVRLELVGKRAKLYSFRFEK